MLASLDVRAAEPSMLIRQHPDQTSMTGGANRAGLQTTMPAQVQSDVLSETGTLACEAWGFDFRERYGDLGQEFAECHHEKPLSELKPGERTKIRDLRIVCANCHRMIHRPRPWLAVAEFANLFLG
ncbi:MAG: hypothetical protein E4H01_08075 [Lysobacterales bacterium]|nr:MAG: hypothetical protein E4H01_08075 [Xanthomonadales bacterium]